MKTNPKQEEWKEKLKYNECIGRFCNHETAEDHFILTLKEIEDLLADQKKELVEEILEKLKDNELVGKKTIKHIINTIKEE